MRFTKNKSDPISLFLNFFDPYWLDLPAPLNITSMGCTPNGLHIQLRFGKSILGTLKIT